MFKLICADTRFVFRRSKFVHKEITMGHFLTMTGMTCVAQFNHRELAMPTVELLRAQGISVRAVVDPLESIAPALSPYRGVALMVPEKDADRARSVLSPREWRKAG